MWSAGVIFFQMLYGRRPFGHEMTQVLQCACGNGVAHPLTSSVAQEAILRDETILRGARNVDFPAKPAVSNEVRDAYASPSACFRVANEPFSGQGLHPPLPHLQPSRPARRPAGCRRCVPELPEDGCQRDQVTAPGRATCHACAYLVRYSFEAFTIPRRPERALVSATLHPRRTCTQRPGLKRNSTFLAATTANDPATPRSCVERAFYAGSELRALWGAMRSSSSAQLAAARHVHAGWLCGVAADGAFFQQSTYCQQLHAHCESVGRVVHVVNLDPAAEHFEYSLAGDVRELVSLEVRHPACACLCACLCFS